MIERVCKIRRSKWLCLKEACNQEDKKRDTSSSNHDLSNFGKGHLSVLQNMLFDSQGKLQSLF